MSDIQKALEESGDFEIWRDNLPDRIHIVAIQRALHQLGWPYDLTSNGGLVVEDANFDSPEFQEAIHWVFMDIYIREGLKELVEDGDIVEAGVNEDGQIMYEVAP